MCTKTDIESYVMLVKGIMKHTIVIFHGLSSSSEIYETPEGSCSVGITSGLVVNQQGGELRVADQIAFGAACR